MSERDQHVHRYLWRDLDSSREPNHYVLTAVPFGDRPSGTIAMTALHTIAKMHEKEHPKAAKAIIENTYADDLIQSTETAYTPWVVLKSSTGSCQVKMKKCLHK